MTSLLLDSNWDLTLDANGNLAATAGDYAIAQDVACACRTWQSELWYDMSRGVQYNLILGQRPPLQFIKQNMIREGTNVPNVGSIQCYFTGPGTNREIGGQIQIYNSSGVVIAVAVSSNFAGDAPWWVNALPQS